MVHKLFLHLILLIAGLALLSNKVSAQGIVIASEKKQTELFASDQAAVKAFADTITSRYNRVILHLGRSYVFRRGNIFTDDKSQKNLRFFSDQLSSKGIPLTLWFFDSFGEEAFAKLYTEHKTIIDENLHMLDSLKIKYAGIAIDMEWINLKNSDNNAKLEEITGYLRQKLPREKRLSFFASLVESDKENVLRGYREDRLVRNEANPIAMLYPVEAGFHLEGQTVLPWLDDKRISSLKHHYKKENWEVAVAVADKWICQQHFDPTEVEPLSAKPEFTNAQLQPDKAPRMNYWKQECFTVKAPLTVDFEKGGKRLLHPGDKIYHFSIDPGLADGDCYLWEYYHLPTTH